MIFKVPISKNILFEFTLHYKWAYVLKNIISFRFLIVFFNKLLIPFSTKQQDFKLSKRVINIIVVTLLFYRFVLKRKLFNLILYFKELFQLFSARLWKMNIFKKLDFPPI